jgi:glycosyltransferase involved in cell wall biosynthesis
VKKLKTSIIIPHRDRNENLATAIMSLRISASYAKLEPGQWEIVVVDGGSKVPPEDEDKVSVIQTHADDPFNKSRLSNIGIANADGDLLTFLDADAIVGPQFFLHTYAALGADPGLTKIAYRVRTTQPAYVSYGVKEFRERRNLSALKNLFSHIRWEQSPIAFEAYGVPHRRGDWIRLKKMQGIIFGNSQQTVPRWTLGEVRFDEQYVGRGFEDIDFNLQLWVAWHPQHQARILIGLQNAMYHVWHEPFAETSHWGPRSYNMLNRKRYMRKWDAARPMLEGKVRERFRWSDRLAQR